MIRGGTVYISVMLSGILKVDSKFLINMCANEVIVSCTDVADNTCYSLFFTGDAFYIL